MVTISAPVIVREGQRLQAVRGRACPVDTRKHTERIPRADLLQSFRRGLTELNLVRVWLQLCLLDRRVNKFRLRDTEVEVYKRCVTFEGSDHLSASAPMTGPALAVRPYLQVTPP